ncbi:hypothetical protein DY000_02006676 [Brassica cretica]|uniref:Uncharacterized protein n=1 Tax=Brassica cretica TaxID=69181 RepID=A0ABQ7BYY1_BRACR|nr:hypothetical protein DY000_02006676 [Brassica cretica]
MDASMETGSVDDIEDDASEINVDRYLLKAVDRQPSSSKEWDPEKAPKIELKQLPAGLKYAFLLSREIAINAVLLRSGKCLIPRAIVEETSESRSRPIILDDPGTESEIPREKERPNTEEEAIDLEEEEGEMEEDAQIDRQERTNVDRQTTVNIDQHSGNNVDRLPTPAEPAVERVYRTLPPFPPNKTQTKRELDKAIWYPTAFQPLSAAS